MTHYHNDQPITGLMNEPDRLNRESFAKHLADILILEPQDECLTVSLEGEWGYGKTSVINLIEKSAHNRGRKPIIIEYNPWLAGKADTLIQDFLIQFSSQLDVAEKTKESFKAAKNILTYAQLFNSMKFMPNVEPWSSTINGIYSVIGDASKKVNKLKDIDLIHCKNKVRETLKTLKQPIVVIIDDIDRLTPDEAFQIIRLVKAVADFPGTSFLLSFDPEYLTGSLSHYGIKKAEQYIDKVVQLRVPLPVIAPKDMQKLANIELANLSEHSLTEHFAEDQKRLSYIYHKHLKYLVRSPRELKRIFNHLKFVLAQIEGEVCFTDLYCLAVLATKAPNIYQSLKDTPEMYVGRRFDERIVFEKRSDVVQHYHQNRQDLLQHIDPRNLEHIQEVIQDLFPLTDNRSTLDHHSEYDRCGRIASEKRLYIALHYQIPPGFASDSDIAAFINGQTSREAYLQRAIEEDFVERFLELLHHNLDKIKASHAIDILHAIYNILLDSDFLESFAGHVQTPFAFDPLRQIIWLSIDLISKQEHKKEILNILIKNSDALVVSADLIHRLMIQHELIPTENPNLKKDIWLSSKDCTQIIDQWSKVAMTQLKNGTLIDSIHASYIYNILKHASPEAKSLFTNLNTANANLRAIDHTIQHGERYYA